MMVERPTKYWIVVASKDHVEIGKKLGIVQANHGKAAPLKRMKAGDLIAFYSPKLHFQGKEPLKKFTAIARVKEGEIYQGDMVAVLSHTAETLSTFPAERQTS